MQLLLQASDAADQTEVNIETEPVTGGSGCDGMTGHTPYYGTLLDIPLVSCPWTTKPSSPNSFPEFCARTRSIGAKIQHWGAQLAAASYSDSRPGQEASSGIS